ncbi:PP2C family protein-serine/threonine phosphatase [Actinoplanes sp. HUAS TT8]|uniref:PP2C family protein-serine/threonine phosphatase n=1 Tax=Actinoplanes sp. HUAS TT8 TaxID=3447453 RepID=UPI003F522BF2
MAESDARRRTWLVLMTVALAYATGALVAFLVFGATSIVVLFLPAGVTLSALLLNPPRRWPAILLTVIAVELVIDVRQGISFPYACGFALANTAEPLLGATLLRRNVPGDVDLSQRRDLLAFLGCCVLAGPLLGAVIGATTITIGQDRGWLESFLPFWAGDATGALTMAGTVLAWRGPLRAAVLPLLATVAVTAVGFWPQHLPLFYLPIPLLFGLAFNRSLAVTMPAGLAMAITANTMTSSGHGPWAVLDGPVELKTATLQLFLAVTILGACFLTVGIAERDQALLQVSAARRLQRALLPTIPDARPGVRVRAGYRPADLTHDVGGDWYDVFDLPGDRIGIAVGDIVGHDLAAAAAMARTQATLRVLAQPAPGPSEVLAALERASTLISGSYAGTVGYADLNLTTRLLRYVCAGHPPPLLVTAEAASFLWEGRSLPIAVNPGEHGHGSLTVPDGAHLIFYTDGLIERRGESLQVGLERLAATALGLVRAGVGDLCHELLRAMPAPGPATDDTVVLCLHFP